MAISIHKLYGQIFKIWRAKRFKLFGEKLQPTRDDRLVDVGGYPAFWISHAPIVRSIDSINLEKYPWDGSSHPEHRITTLAGDGKNLEIADNSYDIAFSNSVIEHVGAWEDQVAFAEEIRRIGDALWVQTPAYECPIEPHYLAPFVHWLPPSIRRKVVRYATPWGWMTKPSVKDVDFMVDTTRLLTYKEMQTLFPDCEIHKEYLFKIIPKSYVAIRHKGAL